MERVILPRSSQAVLTDLGFVQVKIVTLPDGSVRKYAEYESLKAIAEEKEMALIDVKRIIEKSL